MSQAAVWAVDIGEREKEKNLFLKSTMLERIKLLFLG